MEKIDFVKIFEENETRGYVFYDCGFAHKNLNKYFTYEEEQLLMTKDNMYSKQKINTGSNPKINSKFVINLDDIWSWLGFSQKAIAKNLLEKHFVIDIDYIKVFSTEQKQGRGGHNKENICMSLKTFNLFCLKGDTKMTTKIHEYYVKLEHLFIDTIEDEFSLFKKNTQIEGEYIKSLDELIPLLTKQKDSLTRHLIKNYKENFHYIIEKTEYVKGSKTGTCGKGGHNKINYMMTEYTFELLKNSFNLRNRYITNISDNIKCINVTMCIENQTIGFIENSFNTVVDVKRQYMFDTYKVDLFFPAYNLVIECDEYNHEDRDKEYEKIRENYILSLGNSIIRFNPNDKKFELSLVLKEINKILFSKEELVSHIVLLP